MFRAIGAACAIIFSSAFAAAQPQPPIEAYGELEDIRYAALSDNGKRIALAINRDGNSLVTVYDENQGFTASVDTSGIAVRGLNFIGNDHIIIRASETTRIYGFRGDIDYSAAFSMNLKTKKIKQLLTRTDGIYPGQSGLGKIVGQSESGNIFMPAFMGSIGAVPSMDLLTVDKDSGRGRRHQRGRPSTIDFIVSEDGTILAREDYSNKSNKYEIYSWRTGKKELIYSQENADQIPFSLMGVTPDGSKLIIANRSKSGNNRVLREMDLSGKISAPIMSRNDADIEWVIMDDNRVVQGVEFSGPTPTYEFFDKALTADLAALAERTEAVSVNLVDWTNDWRYLLLNIKGAATSGMYVRYDRNTKKSLKIGDMRPDIPPAAIGPIYTIEYPARDGLTIPAVLTFPPGLKIEETRNLPLIVMPHGGPTAYDSLTFDWMAQYFANRGYLVLQPNFRGSSGYGTQFLNAGNGEWGRKMQDDVTDGVQALINDTLADPDRVCIVGASYGGYSALAGGAFTPDLYKCVVAIAPVSDLPRMLRDEKRSYGRNHWVVTYWENRIADGDASKDRLKSISPINHADAFQAPVLLIHGKDDTVVPIVQSEVMRKALKRAGKDVELIKLKGEDHWLSDGDTRLQTLKAMSAFVEKHIGQ